jgi:autotransporter-associated beta strand protein
LGQGHVGTISFQTTTDLFHNASGVVLQFDANTTGAGALNKHGVGAVTFTRANSFNGLNLYGGTVVAWNLTTALGTNSVTLGQTGSSSNVSLFLGNTNTYTNAITVSSGSGTRLIGNTDVTNQLGGFGFVTAITGNAILSGGMTLNTNVTFAITNYVATTTDRMTVSGAITGTAGVIKTGSGFLLLSGSNTYSGDTVLEGGNIQTAASNSFSSASVLKFGATTNSRRLQLQGNSQTLGGVDSTAATGGTLIVESAADNVSNSPATLTLDVAAGRSYDFSGYVRNAAGTATNSALTLVKNGAGTQMLSGSSGWVNYSGTTTINGGVLEFSGANSVAGNSAITLGGGTVRFSGGGTRSNTISGTGNLEKTGANTLVLAGTNSYAGTTRVLGGTLLITGDSSAATGSLMVSPGATFGGSGQFGGEVWFDVGARLPLTSGATLTLAPAGQVSFAGLNPIDISGLGLATAAGTYRLVDGTVGPSAIAALGEANAVHYGLRSKAWFELEGGLVLRVQEKPLALPDVFPINMGFKTLLSTTNDPNSSFDTLANAGRYAIHHGNAAKMDEIKAAFPNVMTIAMNKHGPERSTDVRDAETGDVWPGFFLYRTGSRLTATIDASVTQIPVEDATRFTTLDYALLSPLNAQGRPEFLTSAATGASASYEIVNVTGVDTNSNTLTVLRAQTATTAKVFTAGQSAALPFRENWKVDNKITQIRPNYSLNAPRHPVTGKNAAEFWGEGRGMDIISGINDGTEQDIVNCLAGEETDTDVDLVPDSGFVNGINVYSLGWQEHVAIVRGIIGPNRILQHDCTLAKVGYRGWKNVNGIQIETFGKGKDFSENFDLLSQWVQYAEVQPAFSYGYCREPTTTYGGVQPDNDWMFRKQFAAGLMVGMPHPYGSDDNFGLFDWDEQRGGELDDYAWLGRALGPYVRDFSGLGATDLLAGGSWTVATAAGFAATHSGTPFDPEGIEINVNQIPPLLQGDPVYSGVMLKWNSAALDLQRGAEYTLVFEARASDSITFNGKTYEGLPGFVRVTDFDGTIARFNLIVPHEWRTYRMSYVVPATGGSARFKAEFLLGEEAQRTFRLRNIRLYTGTADRLKREFENGVVLLNESQVTPWTATLGSGQHRRLKGNIRPDINNGATVTGSVNVPARDAVYLLTPTYANWAKERGLDMASGTGAGMSDDPDADGIPNLMEWVLAGHPLTRNTARPAVFRMENGALVFQFERTLQSKEAVACHVEHTTELQSTAPWTRIPVDGPSPPGVTITRVDLGDGTERIRVALAPSASAPRLFVRLVAVAGP